MWPSSSVGGGGGKYNEFQDKFITDDHTGYISVVTWSPFLQSFSHSDNEDWGRLVGHELHQLVQHGFSYSCSLGHMNLLGLFFTVRSFFGVCLPIESKEQTKPEQDNDDKGRVGAFPDSF